MKLFPGFREKAVIVFPLVYYFVGPLAFMSYLFSISLAKLRMKIGFAALTVFLLFLIIYHLITSGFESIFQIRFFWGWALFFIFFSTYRLDKTYVLYFKKLLILLCLYTLFEAVAVNFFIDASSLPNYPQDRLAAGTHFSDIYQRPYSFGGSATVTSALLVAMSLMVQLRLWNKILLALTVLVLGSSVGILLFMFSLIAGNTSNKNVVISTVVLVLILTGYFAFVPDEYLGRDKMAYEYFMVTSDMKLESALSLVNTAAISDIIIGKISEEGIYGGDFAMYSLVLNFGLIGLVILGLFIFYASSGSTFLPLFILFVGSFHYGVMFSLPGQMLFGLLLAGGLDLKEVRRVQRLSAARLTEASVSR